MINQQEAINLFVTNNGVYTVNPVVPFTIIFYSKIVNAIEPYPLLENCPELYNLPYLLVQDNNIPNCHILLSYNSSFKTKQEAQAKRAELLQNHLTITKNMHHSLTNEISQCMNEIISIHHELQTIKHQEQQLL